MPATPDPPAPIDNAALLRVVIGEGSPDEQAAVAAWLAAHPDEQMRIEWIRQALAATQGPVTGPDVGAEWEAMEHRIAFAPARLAGMPESGAVRRDPGLKSASAAGIGAGSFPTAGPGAPSGPSHTAAHGGRRIGWRSADRATARMAAAAVLMVGAAGALFVRSHSIRRTTLTLAPREYATATGMRGTVALPDGTTLTLAPTSRVTLAAAYGESQRDLSLEGEAMFTVSHDAHRPFRVHTRDAVTEDRGTRFVVRSYPGDADTRVTVVEGQVAVHSGAEASSHGVSLNAGDFATVSSAGGVSVRHDANTAMLTAWTTGRLVFDGAPLPKVLVELSRWYGVPIRIGDPTLATRHVTASFPPSTLESVLDLIASSLGARYEMAGDGYVFYPLPPQ